GRADRDCPTLGDPRPLEPALPRSGGVPGLGLDEREAAGAAGAGGIAAGDLGPLRLGRAEPDHSRDRGRDGLGDAWPRGCAGLLVPPTGAGGRCAQHHRLRGRWRRGDRRMKRFAQLLELLALTPSRTRKLNAMTTYFRET